jgi:multidrug efflux pump subunit AcrA (membrane-fusion protein)
VPVRPAAGLPLLEAPARVLLSPEATAEVVPPFRGRITRIHVRPGQKVARGAPIIDVVMPELLRAAGAYLAAGTRLGAYGKRRAQLQSLRGEGLVRLSDLAEVETHIAEAQADQQAALGTLRAADLSGADAARLLQGGGTLTLRAPIPGVITHVRATLGETHENTDLPLATIAGEGGVQIEARLGRPLPAGAQVSFISATGTTVPLRSLSSAPVVDPRDGTTLAWFAPAEEARAAGLPGGTQGRLRAVLSDGAPAPDGGGAAPVAIPARALLPDPRGAAVLRRRAGQVAQVAVEVLSTSGTDALVRGDLRPGDEVAADAGLAQAGGGNEP